MDRTQAHRAFLTRLSQLLLLLPSDPLAPNLPSGPAAAPLAPSPPDAALPAAVCSAVCALLDLEYRALTASLPTIWGLLVTTSSATHAENSASGSAHAPGTGSAAAEEERAGGGGGAEGPLDGAGGGLDVAAACARRLLLAYAELRQVQALLEHLVGALVEEARGQGAEGRGGLALLVLQPRVLDVVATVVSKLHPGACAFVHLLASR